MLKLLYEQTGHPIFQNRIYDLAQESKDCLKVDIRLVEDGGDRIGIQRRFCPDLMNYDGNYQN